MLLLQQAWDSFNLNIINRADDHTHAESTVLECVQAD